MDNFDSLRERDPKLRLPGYRTSLEIQYIIIRTLVWPLVWVLLLASPIFFAFTLVVYSIILLFNLSYVALTGTVFIIGAAISFVLDQDILITLALIGIGVAWNYVEIRNRKRRHSEELGALLKLIDQNKKDSTT